MGKKMEGVKFSMKTEMKIIEHQATTYCDIARGADGIFKVF